MVPTPLTRILTRRALLRSLGAAGAALALGVRPRFARTQAAATATANAIGADQLVQSGVTTPAAEVVTWRVLRGEIDTTGSAMLARAAGFVLPERGPGLFVKEGGNEAEAVTGANAAFVAEGASQQYASLGPDPTRYLRIGLVTLKDADFPADGELVTQPPHPEMTPPAEVRLELYRASIVAGEEWRLPAGIGWPLAIAQGGSLKFGTAGTSIALKSGQAAVLVADDPKQVWTARCPKGTADAELLLALVADPNAPVPDSSAAGTEPAAEGTPDANPAPATASGEGGTVTVKVLRCAAAEFDDTCVIRADAEELERYRLTLIGPVEADRSPRADTVYYPITAEAPQADDGSFVFSVPAGLYEFGSRGEGSLPAKLDGKAYGGEPFDVGGTHLIEVITPNW